MSIPELLGLINKYLKKNISEEEMDVLEELLKKEGNAEVFKEMVKEDYLLKSTNREFDTHSALHKTFVKIDSLPKENRITINHIYKWAAVLAIPLGLFFIWKMSSTEKVAPADENRVRIVFSDGSHKELIYSIKDSLLEKNQEVVGTVENGVVSYENAKESMAINTLEVPYGKHFQLLLSDGTRIHLNSGSSLTYPVSFAGKENRTVSLEGEAFFEVSKDAKRPFTVNTAELDIEVLGTEFNVSAYREDNQVYTTLREGSVKVNNSNGEFLLEPNDQTVWDKASQTMEKRVVDVSRFTAWMDDEIVFTSTSFDEILKILERHHDIKIINTLPDISNERFTARFDKESIDQIMNYFSKSYGFNYIANEDIIIIEK
ncbi:MULTISPECIES: FecR family protein [Flavobacteriaceae]|uniref:FecR family protein n=1 Tax=Flavobacteriaceae TaxID=49546 RepID=UPI0014908C1C|nr:MULTISPECIES: FecR domain-containing protein [Allomuricauda]MDC6367790.1 FecR domain-containing protein [Muricauda sp. AC10]